MIYAAGIWYWSTNIKAMHFGIIGFYKITYEWQIRDSNEYQAKDCILFSMVLMLLRSEINFEIQILI